MCQLNIYCVPKAVEPKKVITALNNAFNSQLAEHITDPYFDVAGLENYNLYACSAMHCNCGSVLCKFQEENTTLTWQELKQSLINAELEKLYKIKTSIEQPDYKQRYKNFEKQQKALWAECEKTQGNVGKIERELTDKVLKRTDITDEEKSKILHEEVYPEVNKLLLENEKRPERAKAMKAYQEFMQENNHFVFSSLYTTDPVVDGNRKIVGKDENGKEVVSYEFTIIKNIDDEIERTKQTLHNEEETEFEELKGVVESLLELATDVKLFAFWQDGDPICIGETFNTTLDNLKFEDIAYLKYKDVLTVSKY